MCRCGTSRTSSRANGTWNRLCPSDTVSENSFVEMQPGERYAMGSYVASFGPPDLDDNQEQRDGMFSRNSSTRTRDVRDGLSNTLCAGERQNGPFRNGAAHGVHFSYETTWCCAVREITDLTDDHGHMALFQTGHTPNSPFSDDRDVSAPHVGYANFLFGTDTSGVSRKASTSTCIRHWGRRPEGRSSENSESGFASITINHARRMMNSPNIDPGTPNEPP